jgi:hypothetical protein
MIRSILRRVKTLEKRYPKPTAGEMANKKVVGSFSQSEWIRARVNHPKRTPFLPPRSLRFC